jgi:hypothetical protein
VTHNSIISAGKLAAGISGRWDKERLTACGGWPAAADHLTNASR